ncbi:MAG: NADP-dependent malic enzyme [Microgenomates group bacterium]
MDTIYKEALAFHRAHQGKLTTASKVELKDKHDLALAYTPGVAEPCRVIAKDIKEAYNLTWKGRTVAVISDGSAVLGLGNIGPTAGIPVMEGKALLMKQFAGIDAIPLVIDTQNPEEIIRFVKHIAPNFAGINLEDVSAPRCFQIEEALQDIGIPVFHDDQHGTAIVVSAALHNAAKVVGKPFNTLKVVVVGAGAAGLAISRMLLGLDCYNNTCQYLSGIDKVGDLIVVDKTGALYAGRPNQNIYKQALAGMSNIHMRKGPLSEVIVGADVVIGVSGPGSISPEMVKSMAKKAIVFAMANPLPEIMPDAALRAGAYVVATGRSDFPNQINNVLAFPGVFKAVVDGRLRTITSHMKIAASRAIQGMILEPTVDRIIPDPFTPDLAKKVSEAILAAR